MPIRGHPGPRHGANIRQTPPFNRRAGELQKRNHQLHKSLFRPGPFLSAMFRNSREQEHWHSTPDSPSRQRHSSLQAMLESGHLAGWLVCLKQPILRYHSLQRNGPSTPWSTAGEAKPQPRTTPFQPPEDRPLFLGRYTSDNYTISSPSPLGKLWCGESAVSHCRSLLVRARTFAATMTLSASVPSRPSCLLLFSPY